MDPPKRPSTLRSSKNAAKRKAQFDESEASLAPNQRLRQRTDWDAAVQRDKAQRTMDKYLMVMDWFHDFSSSYLELPDGDSNKYFRVHGPTPSIETVRQFLAWIARTHRKTKGTTVLIRLSTLGGYLDALWGAVKYFNAPFPPHETDQHRVWLVDFLAPQENLNLVPELKPVAYPRDVTFLLQNLFRPNVLMAFPTMHQVLQFALILNLSIDLMGRIGELVLVGARDADDNVAKSHWIKHLLIWRRVEFWLYLQDDGSLDIVVLLTVTGMKGQKKTPGEFKTIPLRALSPELAFEDSCRLLLYLAIIEGHIEIDGVDGLASMQNLQTSSAGRKLEIKEASLDLPVFQQCTLTGETTTRPMAYHAFWALLVRLSRASGIVDFNITSRCMRRGIAYHLNRSTDVDTRKQLMGHRENSRVFSKYQAQTAQVDAQAILRGLPMTDVTKYSSILKGRIPDVPLQISAAGIERVTSDRAVVAAQARQSKALESLLRVFKNVAEAREAASPLYDVYAAAQQAKHNLRNSMNRLQYAQEVKDHAQKHMYASRPAIPRDDQADIAEGSTTEQAPAATTWTSSYEADTEALRAYQSDLTHEPISIASAECIDPQLLESQDTSTSDEQEQIDPVDLSERSARQSPISASEDDRVEVRQHNILNSRDMIATCPRPTIAADIFNVIIDGDLSHDDVDQILLPFFKVKHSLTRYPTHLMPVPGTTNCRFCGLSWESWEIPNPDLQYASRFTHIKNCSFEALELVVRAEIDDAQRAQFEKLPPCPWIRGKNPIGPCQVECASANELSEHLFIHRHSSTSKCRIGGECGQKLTSDSVYQAHAWMCHRVAVGDPTNTIIQWCDWCEDWLALPINSDEEEQHFSTHIDQASKTIRDYGYRGCSDGSRTLVPAKCIFCFHSTTISSKERLFCPLSFENQQNHLWSHTSPKKIDGVDGTSKAYCPASKLSGTDHVLCLHDEEMGSSDLRRHLQHVHGIICPGDSYESPFERLKKKREAKTAPSSAATPQDENASSSGVVGREVATAMLSNKSVNTKGGKRKAAAIIAKSKNAEK